MSDLSERTVVGLFRTSSTSPVVVIDIKRKLPRVHVKYLLLHVLRALHLVLLVRSITRPPGPGRLPPGHSQVVGLPLTWHNPLHSAWVMARATYWKPGQCATFKRYVESQNTSCTGWDVTAETGRPTSFCWSPPPEFKYTFCMVINKTIKRTVQHIEMCVLEGVTHLTSFVFLPWV